MNRSALLVAAVTIVLAASLILALPLAAQEKPADHPRGPSRDKKLSAASPNSDDSERTGPVIFFPEPMHDFGTVARGSKVTHNFKVLNKGDEPLKLIKAKGS